MNPKSLVNIGDYSQADILRILESAARFKPVSYTHLDVYKRQDLGTLNFVL